MKKELIAAALLLSLMTLAVINLIYLKHFTSKLIGLTDEAFSYVSVGKWEEAKKKAEEAERLWSGKDAYTHIAIRHSEINEASEAFYELLGEVYKEYSGGAKGAWLSLRSNIKSIYEMEKLSLKSIF